jgi:hypothetical protein
MMNAFHKSNLGSFGENLSADMHGYVPTADCGPWDLTYDHGTELTHDSDGNLTPYGEWWESDRWPEIVAEAVAATEAAEDGLAGWQQS